jgi:putative colanic acid biosysnthesis UDP-glucose lipid carrier transferase
MEFRLHQIEPVLITLFRICDALLSAVVFCLTVYFIKPGVPYLIFAGIFIFLVTMLVFEYGKLYVSWRFRSIREEIHRLIVFSIVVCVITIVSAYLLQAEFIFSRRVIFVWMVIWPFLLSVQRIIVRSGLKYIRRKGRNIRRAIIIGTGPLGVRLAKWINENPWSGTKIEGFFNGKKENVDGYPVIGTYDEVSEYVRKNKIDIVYIALPSNHTYKLRLLLGDLMDTTTSIYYLPGLCFEYLQETTVQNYVDIFPILSITDSNIRGINAFVKRMEDIIFASLILMIIGPLMLLIALVTRIITGQPAIFKQWRYGIDGTPIQVRKFRTMTVSEDGYTMKPARNGDGRITKYGKFLRRFSLDELPQLINVLEGSMSLVGPRPHAISMVEEYRKKIAGSMMRHKIKPGITGLAQIYGTRAEVDSFEKLQKRIEYDLSYLYRWSLWLDIKIIFLTFFEFFNFRREIF